MASDHWLSTRILWLLFRAQAMPLAVLVLLLQLIVEPLPIIENLHELVIHFVTVELLEDILLVLKLVLRLLSLLSSLLFLNDGECILWLIRFTLANTLCPFVLLSLVCLLLVNRILPLWRSNGLLALIYASDA